MVIALTLGILGLIAALEVHSSKADTPKTTTAIQHVVMIMEENHSASSITSSSMPYLTSLGNTYEHGVTNAVTHPSLPNYFAITSGGTQGASNDCGTSTNRCTTGANNIYHQGSWKQLSESMPKPCDHNNASPYVVHHAIAPFYTDLNTTCTANDVSLNKSAVPQITAGFTFITPNNLDNAHSASLGQADNWLKTVVPQLLRQAAFTNGSTVIEITFDEGSGSNTVYTAILNPAVQHRTFSGKFSHYSLLRLNESLLGYSFLGNAANAPDMRSAVGL